MNLLYIVEKMVQVVPEYCLLSTISRALIVVEEQKVAFSAHIPLLFSAVGCMFMLI